MANPALVTAAEISRIAGVTRATVSNWRRRHPDFPAPTGGTEASPAYDLAAVRTWLADRGQLPENSPADDLQTALRAANADSGTVGRLLPLVLAADRLPTRKRAELLQLSDQHLVDAAQQAARSCADDVPGVGKLTYRAGDAALLRAVLACVAGPGAAATLDVLAGHDTDDTTVSGNYQTPAALSGLMADLLTGPDASSYPASVLDPACGNGGLLAAAAERGATELHGQDIVPAQAAQAAVRLGVATAKTTWRIRAGDSLRADAFAQLTADAVLCAPPYGDRDWGHDKLTYDPRWEYGLPPRGEPELAWVQHCLAHLAPGAPAVLLMPPAAAERAGGRRLRAELLRRGALRAVVALPPGTATPAHVGLHLWLLHRPPEGAPARPVLFVNASPSDTERPPPDSHRTHTGGGRRAAVDWAALRQTVLDAWHDHLTDPDDVTPIPGVTRTVPVIDLLDDVVDLTPGRHVRATPVSVRPDQFAATADALRERLHRAAASLGTLSSGDTWPPSGEQVRSWRTATVADLLRGDALTLLRAPVATRHTVAGSPTDRGGPRTLTAHDVAADRAASGPPEEPPTGAEITIEDGDVILTELLQQQARTARVADGQDAGSRLGRHLFLLRPDPARLDPWFLAGFLSAEENVNTATTGSTVLRVDVRRLRVPLLPLAEQQRYGQAFRRLHALRQAAELAGRLADETARTLAAGLTGGALLPPDAPPPTSAS